MTQEQVLAQLQELADLVPDLTPAGLKRLEGVLARLLEQLEEEQEAEDQLSLPLEPPPALPKDGEIFIWSDGACSGNPGPGGWGTIVDAGGQRRELWGYSPKTTNNIMEMTGALKGLLACPVGAKITLTTDSKYLVQGMTQWIFSWKKKGWRKADGQPVLNQELWQALDQAASQRKVKWEWVKGHAGHEENERCDQLAREAIKNRG